MYKEKNKTKTSFIIIIIIFNFLKPLNCSMIKFIEQHMIKRIMSALYKHGKADIRNIDF